MHLSFPPVAERQKALKVKYILIFLLWRPHQADADVKGIQAALQTLKCGITHQPRRK